MKRILGSDRIIKSSLLISLPLTASACQQAPAPQGANAGSQPSASSAEQRWKQPLRAIALGQREQGEAIGYHLDGKALLTTSEGKRAPLIQVVRPNCETNPDRFQALRGEAVVQV